MQSLRTGKTMVSAGLALLLVLALVLPVLSTDYLAGQATPFDVVQAGSIHWGIVAAVFLLWLGVQFFWPATPETTKLGMTISATILWLSLALFFNFQANTVCDLLGTECTGAAQYGGAVAFFTLMGGLGIVLLWTRFLADEVTF